MHSYDLYEKETLIVRFRNQSYIRESKKELLRNILIDIIAQGYPNKIIKKDVKI